MLEIPTVLVKTGTGEGRENIFNVSAEGQAQIQETLGQFGSMPPVEMRAGTQAFTLQLR